MFFFFLFTCRGGHRGHGVHARGGGQRGQHQRRRRRGPLQSPEQLQRQQLHGPTFPQTAAAPLLNTAPTSGSQTASSPVLSYSHPTSLWPFTITNGALYLHQTDQQWYTLNKFILSWSWVSRNHTGLRCHSSIPWPSPRAPPQNNDLTSPDGILPVPAPPDTPSPPTVLTAPAQWCPRPDRAEQSSVGGFVREVRAVVRWRRLRIVVWKIFIKRERLCLCLCLCSRETLGDNGVMSRLCGNNSLTLVTLTPKFFSLFCKICNTKTLKALYTIPSCLFSYTIFRRCRCRVPTCFCSSVFLSTFCTNPGKITAQPVVVAQHKAW